MTGSGRIDAERAFTRAARARRLGALARRGSRCLRVHEHAMQRRGGGRQRLREVPLDQITGTLEPSRSGQFDGALRPAAVVRERWQRIWLAEHRGAVLPPVELVAVDDGYAIRDGHHRVSVARARGALTIDAAVEE